MTDPLDRLAPVAGQLLRRADDTLAAAGAAPDDPIWPLLRRVRALPAEAVTAVAGWSPSPLAEAAPALGTLARRYAGAVEATPARPPWQGAGAQAYALQWAALRGHVAGASPHGPAEAGGDSMAGRLAATARYAEELADWVVRSRRAVAVALAEVLDSAEAVTVVTEVAPAAAGPAAARIGAHVLGVVAAACDEGQRMHDEWRPRLVELPYRQPGAVAPPAGATLRVSG